MEEGPFLKFHCPRLLLLGRKGLIALTLLSGAAEVDESMVAERETLRLPSAPVLRCRRWAL